MLFVPIPANALILLSDDKGKAQNGTLQTDQATNCASCRNKFWASGEARQPLICSLDEGP